MQQRSNSPGHYSIGTPSVRHPRRDAIPPTACRHTVSGTFHSPHGVLFTFPSRYWFTIGHRVVFSLTRWSWRIQARFHVSRPTWEIRRQSSAFRLRGCHPVSRRFPAASPIQTICNCPVRLTPNQSVPTTPAAQHCQVLPCQPVWAVPCSLAATGGITTVFFSCRYLDVSVPCVRFLRLWIQRKMTGCDPGRVAPFGDLRLRACLQLNGAYRSLPRPSSPLCAKASTECP